MDETETVVLSVCVTISQEDMIWSQVSQEDMILSHVYIYVCVVRLITNYFCKVLAYLPIEAFTQAWIKLFPKIENI